METFKIVNGIFHYGGHFFFQYLFLNWIFTLFTNPSDRAGYDSRSIFKRSLTGLNSKLSF